MHPKSLKWLEDIRSACDLILSATRKSSLQDYETDRLLRSAIERNFEIIGEALMRMRQTDPAMAERIRECRDIIAFRNLLIHAYDFIDNKRVWRIVRDDVPRLLEEVISLLHEVEGDESRTSGPGDVR